jgi:hypothetical protein
MTLPSARFLRRLWDPVARAAGIYGFQARCPNHDTKGWKRLLVPADLQPIAFCSGLSR